ncbi:MAG: hypothetical protein WBJ10_05800 [Daejeonella sp.]|uniref:hypothetical protein n=1 Tax=Daejeonella sp. TaxID=2805397 RepID=UPI003C75E271
MLKNRNTQTEAARPLVSINEGAEISNEDKLRIRRELVNAAIEVVGYDPVKIEQYLNRKNVA